MMPRREPTKAELARAKAKEIADAAKFRDAARRAADEVQAKQDAEAESRRQNREQEQEDS
jgi:hypothetical protein